jgi:hypothetical protein
MLVHGLDVSESATAGAGNGRVRNLPIEHFQG